MQRKSGTAGSWSIDTEMISVFKKTSLIVCVYRRILYWSTANDASNDYIKSDPCTEQIPESFLDALELADAADIAQFDGLRMKGNFVTRSLFFIMQILAIVRRSPSIS